MTLRILAITLLATIGLTISGPAQTYREPTLDKKIFERADLKIDKISAASLMGGLLSVANDYDDNRGVNYELRGHALSIAARLKPDSGKLLDIMTQLKNRGTTAGDEQAKKSRTIGRIYRGVKALLKKEDHPANKICAQYSISIALRLNDTIHTDSKDIFKDAKKLEGLQQSLGTPDWSGLLKKPNYPNPWKGYAERNYKPRKQSVEGKDKATLKPGTLTLSGLSRLKTQAGAHEGIILKISAKASPSDDSEALSLIIPQDVDAATGSHLKLIRRFLKKRHKKEESLPGGWKIDLTFGDPDEAIKFDGHTIGATMALAIESLITGNEIDNSFAIAGGFGEDGTIKRMGNTLAQIEKARQAGFTRITVPRDNGPILHDVMNSKGLEELLAFELYTPGKFDQLLELVTGDSHKSDSFSKFATTLKKKGLVYLKSEEAQEKLATLLKEQPHHATVFFLNKLAKNEEHLKKSLSIPTSYYSIESLVSDHRVHIHEIALEIGYDQKESHLKEAKKALSGLKELEPKIHPQSKEYFASVVAAIESFTAYLKAEKAPEKDEAFDAVKKAYQKAYDAHNEFMDVEKTRKMILR